MSTSTVTFFCTLPNGQQQGSQLFTFDVAGDEVPLHTHPFWHNCLVLRGSVDVYDSTGKTVIVKAGEFAEFAAGREHAVRAREPGTMTMHTSEPGAGSGGH
jgi:quercetin dioxygenase-like cupin family protein